MSNRLRFLIVSLICSILSYALFLIYIFYFSSPSVPSWVMYFLAFIGGPLIMYGAAAMIESLYKLDLNKVVLTSYVLVSFYNLLVGVYSQELGHSTFYLGIMYYLGFFYSLVTLLSAAVIFTVIWFARR